MNCVLLVVVMFLHTTTSAQIKVSLGPIFITGLSPRSVNDDPPALRSDPLGLQKRADDNQESNQEHVQDVLTLQLEGQGQNLPTNLENNGNGVIQLPAGDSNKDKDYEYEIVYEYEIESPDNPVQGLLMNETKQKLETALHNIVKNLIPSESKKTSSTNEPKLPEESQQDMKTIEVQQETSLRTGRTTDNSNKIVKTIRAKKDKTSQEESDTDPFVLENVSADDWDETADITFSDHGNSASDFSSVFIIQGEKNYGSKDFAIDALAPIIPGQVNNAEKDVAFPLDLIIPIIPGKVKDDVVDRIDFGIIDPVASRMGNIETDSETNSVSSYDLAEKEKSEYFSSNLNKPIIPGRINRVKKENDKFPSPLLKDYIMLQSLQIQPASLLLPVLQQNRKQYFPKTLRKAVVNIDNSKPSNLMLSNRNDVSSTILRTQGISLPKTLKDHWSNTRGFPDVLNKKEYEQYWTSQGPVRNQHDGSFAGAYRPTFFPQGEVGYDKSLYHANILKNRELSPSFGEKVKTDLNILTKVIINLGSTKQNQKFLDLPNGKINAAVQGTRIKRQGVGRFATNIITDVTEPIRSLVPELNAKFPNFFYLKLKGLKNGDNTNSVFSRAGKIDLNEFVHKLGHKIKNEDVESVESNNRVKRENHAKLKRNSGTIDLPGGFSVNLGPLGGLFQTTHKNNKYKNKQEEEKWKEPATESNITQGKNRDFQTKEEIETKETLRNTSNIGTTEATSETFDLIVEHDNATTINQPLLPVVATTVTIDLPESTVTTEIPPVTFDGSIESSDIFTESTVNSTGSTVHSNTESIDSTTTTEKIPVILTENLESSDNLSGSLETATLLGSLDSAELLKHGNKSEESHKRVQRNLDGYNYGFIFGYEYGGCSSCQSKKNETQLSGSETKEEIKSVVENVTVTSKSTEAFENTFNVGTTTATSEAIIVEDDIATTSNQPLVPFVATTVTIDLPDSTETTEIPPVSYTSSLESSDTLNGSTVTSNTDSTDSTLTTEYPTVLNETLESSDNLVDTTSTEIPPATFSSSFESSDIFNGSTVNGDIDSTDAKATTEKNSVILTGNLESSNDLAGNLETVDTLPGSFDSAEQSKHANKSEEPHVRVRRNSDKLMYGLIFGYEFGDCSFCQRKSNENTHSETLQQIEFQKIVSKLLKRLLSNNSQTKNLKTTINTSTEKVTSIQELSDDNVHSVTSADCSNNIEEGNANGDTIPLKDHNITTTVQPTSTDVQKPPENFDRSSTNSITSRNLEEEPTPIHKINHQIDETKKQLENEDTEITSSQSKGLTGDFEVIYRILKPEVVTTYDHKAYKRADLPRKLRYTQKIVKVPYEDELLSQQPDQDEKIEHYTKKGVRRVVKKRKPFTKLEYRSNRQEYQSPQVQIEGNAYPYQPSLKNVQSYAPFRNLTIWRRSSKRFKRFLPALGAKFSVATNVQKNHNGVPNSLSIKKSLGSKLNLNLQQKIHIAKGLRIGLRAKRSPPLDKTRFQKDCKNCKPVGDAGSYGFKEGPTNFGYTSHTDYRYKKEQTENHGGYGVTDTVGLNRENIQIVDVIENPSLLLSERTVGPFGVFDNILDTGSKTPSKAFNIKKRNPEHSREINKQNIAKNSNMELDVKTGGHGKTGSTQTDSIQNVDAEVETASETTHPIENSFNADSDEYDKTLAESVEILDSTGPLLDMGVVKNNGQTGNLEINNNTEKLKVAEQSPDVNHVVDNENNLKKPVELVFELENLSNEVEEQKYQQTETYDTANSDNTEVVASGNAIELNNEVNQRGHLEVSEEADISGTNQGLSEVNHQTGEVNLTQVPNDGLSTEHAGKIEELSKEEAPKTSEKLESTLYENIEQNGKFSGDMSQDNTRIFKDIPLTGSLESSQLHHTLKGPSEFAVTNNEEKMHTNNVGGLMAMIPRVQITSNQAGLTNINEFTKKNTLQLPYDLKLSLVKPGNSIATGRIGDNIVVSNDALVNRKVETRANVEDRFSVDVRNNYIGNGDDYNRKVVRRVVRRRKKPSSYYSNSRTSRHEVEPVLGFGRLLDVVNLF